MQYFRHGSTNSKDIDTLFVVDVLSDLKHVNAARCVALSKEYNVDGNIITIDRKSLVVSGCHKGTPDELNNGLLATYSLHEQLFPCPITLSVRRDVHLKMLRVLRGILSHCSRTKHRELVKNALRHENLYEKIHALQQIRLATIEDTDKNNSSIIDFHKFLAFQIIQFLGLMYHPQKEIFTKNDAADFYPRAALLISRIPDIRSTDVIDELQEDFIQGIFTLLENRSGHTLQNGKLLRTPFGRLNVKLEIYQAEE